MKVSQCWVVLLLFGYREGCWGLSDVQTSSETFGCRGVCFTRYNSSWACQCNRRCLVYGNCCEDYAAECDSGAMCAKECRVHLPDRNRCQNCSFTGGGCATNEEILEFSKKLWLLNTFKAKPTDFVIDKQGNTTQRGTTDEADKRLLPYVNEEILRLDSFAKLIALLDNYEPNQGVNETARRGERREQNNFLNYVLSTRIGKATRSFLFKHGLSGCGRISHFKKVLRKMWFENYSRKKSAMDTSGFEHVFSGEYYGMWASGFHSWVRYYLLEKAGKINYRGHLDTPEDQLPPGKQLLQMEWDGHVKRITGFVVGTTPEWEFSIYSVCFLIRPNTRCRVWLEDLEGKPFQAEIQSYDWRKTAAPNGLRSIGTVYIV